MSFRATPSGRLSTIFYINRDSDVERRTLLEANLLRLGLEAERVAAVEGRNLPKDLTHWFPTSRLSPGEVGCYASHMLVWRRIAKRDLPYAVVLEDDAKIDDNFQNVLNEILANLPEGWDFVHISTAPRRSYRTIAELPSGGKLVRYARVPYGTSGYLISGAGAAKLLRPVTRIFPVDLDTRRPWVFNLDTYGIDEPPIRLQKLPSTISGSPNKEGRSRVRRGIRIYNPFYTPQSVIYNIGKLGLSWWLRLQARNLVDSAVKHQVRFGLAPKRATTIFGDG